ncbi:MAG: TetR family transcriptional regulator [Rhodobacterales bacterium]|nr:TetR family transcriptional regulator [Rhodobacterales bacterium]
MARPRTSSIKVDTKQRILDAAELEFAANGYGPARLADISARAGIKRPSLLYHFSTKEVLYRAVVLRTFQQIAVVLMTPKSTAECYETRIAGMSRNFESFLAQNTAAARIIVHEIVATEGPGRRLLVQQAAPLLSLVEDYVTQDDEGLLRPEIPVRAAILTTASEALLRHSAGDLREALWGPVVHDQSWILLRAMVLRTASEVLQ